MPIGDLGQQISSAFPKVERVASGGHSVSGHPEAIVVVLKKEVPPELLEADLLEWLLAAKESVVPILLTGAEAERAESWLRTGGWADLAASAGSATLPTAVRGPLANILQAAELEAERLEDEDASSAAHLEWAAATLAQVFSQFLATRGMPLPGGQDPTPALLERLAEAELPRSDFLLLLALRARAARARLLQSSGRVAGPGATDWGAFRAALRRVAAQSPPASRRARGLLVVCLVLAVAGAAALGGWRVYLRRPLTAQGLPPGLRSGGITGDYFIGGAFGKRVLRRTDREIDFNWPGSFLPKMPNDRFSVRWRGYLYLPSGKPRFICLEKDDGGRVFLDGLKILDNWSEYLHRTVCAKLRFRKGWHPLEVEFWENLGAARVRLLTGEDRAQLRVVPSQHLCCRR